MDSPGTPPPPKVSDLSHLPLELLFKTALELELPSLYSFCLSSTELATICQTDQFWRDKYYRDFGPISFQSTISWKGLYHDKYINKINPSLTADKYNRSVLDEQGILYMAGSNIWIGGFSDGKYDDSEKLIRIKFPSKVISFSVLYSYEYYEEDNQFGSHMAALTEEGVYLWFHTPDNKQSPILHDKYQEKYGNSPTKPIKILVNEENYLLLMDNGNIVLWNKIMGFEEVEMEAINIFRQDTEYDSKLYVLTDQKKLCRLIIEAEPVEMKQVGVPEPVKEYFGDARTEFAVSESGNVYVWGQYQYDKNGKLILVGRRQYFDEPTKINFPEPIRSIQVFDLTMAAVTLSGKLYVWGTNQNDRMFKSYDIPLEILGLGPECLQILSADYIRRILSMALYNLDKEIETPLPRIFELRLSDPKNKTLIDSPVREVALGDNVSLVLTADGVVNLIGA